MLGWLKERTTFAKIAGKWYDATRLNPGDNGQIAIFASNLVKNQSVRVEDAWLTSLANWTFHSPYPEFKFLLANGIIRFLDIYEFVIPFDPEAKAASRYLANEIIQSGILSGYPDSSSKDYFPEAAVNYENPYINSRLSGDKISLVNSQPIAVKNTVPKNPLKPHYEKKLTIEPSNTTSEYLRTGQKTCCHCGRKIKFDIEVCGYPDCGLDPDEEVMQAAGIKFIDGKYKFREHYFSNRVDAIIFARMKKAIR